MIVKQETDTEMKAVLSGDGRDKDVEVVNRSRSRRVGVFVLVLS